MSVKFYTLIGQTPTPCRSVLEWAEWLQQGEKHVALTTVGKFEISTVFLAVNLQFGNGPPLLFETMIFHLDQAKEPRSVVFEGYQRERCATWLEAERQHARAVRLMEKKTGLKRQEVAELLSYDP